MPSKSSSYDERLRRRFVVARRIAAGEFGGYALPESVLKETLNVSLKTHQGDIKRAKIFDTFESWKPGKTGPKPGTRISKRLLRVIETLTYERANKKRNDRKLSAELASHFERIGVPAAEQPSESSIRRAILEIYERERRSIVKCHTSGALSRAYEAARLRYIMRRKRRFVFLRISSAFQVRETPELCGLLVPGSLDSGSRFVGLTH